METNAEFDQNSVYTTNIGAEEGTLVEVPESTPEDIVTAINGTCTCTHNTICFW